MTNKILLALVAGFMVVSQVSTAQTLYRHVDANGKVSYSDRPQSSAEKGIKPPPANVSSPEARRQLYQEQRNSEREEMLQRRAQQQRANAVAQREREERLKQQRLEQEQHPERAPRPVRIVR